MSEQENTPPTPPRPTVKTSAVPLKKETVRITLRPQGPGGDAAPPPPAPVAATAPIPPAPTAPAPPAPRPISPTVPLAPPPRPTMPGGPPPPAAARPAPPSASMGSKTIPLSQPPARPTTPMSGRPTGKIAAGTPTTQPLPRATVKLQPTATPSASISSVNVRTSVLDEDDEVDEGPLNIMGWIALVGAIAAVIGVLACSDKLLGDFFSEGIVKAETKESREDAIKQWIKPHEPEGFKLPADFSPFDKKDGKSGIISSYKDLEPDTPTQPAL